MKEKDYLYENILEKVDEVKTRSKEFYITQFLNLKYQMNLEKYLKKLNLNIYYLNNGERKVGVIYRNEEPKFVSPILNYEVSTDFSFTHSEVMGSLLGIGLKREFVGNIYCENNVIEFEILESVKEFVENNFSQISSKKVSISMIDRDIKSKPRKTKEIVVSSLRLDNLVSSLFNISREDAKSAINFKEVELNFEIPTRNDIKITLPAYISLRKKGKYYINEVYRMTKNNHLVILCEKY